MSEDVWCQLQVRVPASWVRSGVTWQDRDKPFLEPEERADWEALCIGLYVDGSPQAWLNAAWEEFYGCPDIDIQIKGNVAEVVMSGDLNYATLNARDQLATYRIPFLHHWDSKYEIDAGDAQYDGNVAGEVSEVDSSNNYVTMVPLGTLIGLREKHARMELGTYDWADFGFAVQELILELDFDLEKCDIDHLRVHPVFIAEGE